MEVQAPGVINSDTSPHKRTKSSVLKSIIPANYRRKPTSKSNSQPYSTNDNGKGDLMHLGNQSILPPDHPNTRQHLREDSGNGSNRIASPKKSIDARKENTSLGETQRMTRSASFKSFAGKEKAKAPNNGRQEDEEIKMKKSKSSTGISTILSRPRSSKGGKTKESYHQKDKENETPPSSAGMAPPPIWAQFVTSGFEEPARTTKIPLNDRSVEEEAALYTPRDYSPSKQRNFKDYQLPTLSQRGGLKSRPKSECIALYPTSASFAETVSGLRRPGRDTGQVDMSIQHQQSEVATDVDRKVFTEEKASTDTTSNVRNRKVSNDSAGSDLPMAKRGSRVMAAVAAFNGKSKELPKEPPKETDTVQLDPKAIEIAFESLLVS